MHHARRVVTASLVLLFAREAFGQELRPVRYFPPSGGDGAVFTAPSRNSGPSSWQLCTAPIAACEYRINGETYYFTGEDHYRLESDLSVRVRHQWVVPVHSYTLFHEVQPGVRYFTGLNGVPWRAVRVGSQEKSLFLGWVYADERVSTVWCTPVDRSRPELPPTPPAVESIEPPVAEEAVPVPKKRSELTPVPQRKKDVRPAAPKTEPSAGPRLPAPQPERERPPVIDGPIAAGAPVRA